jgi:EAL domain-containing protein (putative c-di-GMP-specific phosphodiesterase class I)
VVALTRNALKKSKASGKNRVTLSREIATASGEFDAVTPRSIVEQLTDISSFRTVYQPIIDLSTEEVAGYEVLSRGPDGAFESPGDFFRICIENEILTTVDLQCLQVCLAEIPRMKGTMRFHVNLFPSTLLETPVANLIKLFPEDRTGIIFCIEISEQQFITEPAYLRDQVNALRQAGILVAIDDVGFGRSSLETLILLEPDLVKVDRKYVAGLSNEPAKARLLRRLTNVAKSLGAEIVAEGIEDRRDLPLLKDMGVNYGQGFLWGELLQILPTNEDPSHQHEGSV